MAMMAMMMTMFLLLLLMVLMLCWSLVLLCLLGMCYYSTAVVVVEMVFRLLLSPHPVLVAVLVAAVAILSYTG